MLHCINIIFWLFLWCEHVQSGHYLIFSPNTSRFIYISVYCTNLLPFKVKVYRLLCFGTGCRLLCFGTGCNVMLTNYEDFSTSEYYPPSYSVYNRMTFIRLVKHIYWMRCIKETDILGKQTRSSQGTRNSQVQARIVNLDRPSLIFITIIFEYIFKNMVQSWFLMRVQNKTTCTHKWIK